VFLIAVPIAALAFLASWLIPQVQLKQWPEAGAAAPETDQPVAGAAAAPGAVSAAEAARPATAPASEPTVTHEALDPQDARRADL
jgi:hypothetical protein